jgi:hypothetical protein
MRRRLNLCQPLNDLASGNADDDKDLRPGFLKDKDAEAAAANTAALTDRTKAEKIDWIFYEAPIDAGACGRARWQLARSIASERHQEVVFTEPRHPVHVAERIEIDAVGPIDDDAEGRNDRGILIPPYGGSNPPAPATHFRNSATSP